MHNGFRQLKEGKKIMGRGSIPHPREATSSQLVDLNGEDILQPTLVWIF